MKTPTKYSQPHQNAREMTRRHRQYPTGLDCPRSKSLRRIRSGWRFKKSMASALAAIGQTI